MRGVVHPTAPPKKNKNKKREVFIMKGMNNGMMVMGGEATPENLRKARLIINSMLGEDKPTGCSGCNCTNIKKQILDEVEAEQKAKRDAIGEYIASQFNALIDLAAEVGIEPPFEGAEYDSEFEAIVL
jgi:hypothetical protein